ncbi:DUF4828 domain-containing protein (plasmid) [Lactiplantibacillus plantarum]|uniref:DUF4828 domain-containing protein n=1 Tax=Lactiplantibacillus plantarum TaxID=1590 RepID=UPI00338E5955
MKPGKFKKLVLLIKKNLFNQRILDPQRNQEVMLKSLYVGIWHFLDELSYHTHQLEVTPTFDIVIDKRKLPGRIEHIDTQELVFLDNYGYHLKIDTNDYQPTSLFDEADNHVYPIKIVSFPSSTTNIKNNDS